jgi:hypothetical protein
MIDHDDIQQAIRDRLVTLSVVTTGAITLAATATTYTRSTGSFLTDGFWPGMEVTASGFGNAADGTAVVTAVAAGVLTVNRTLPVTGAGAGRTLLVTLPAQRAWENQAFAPPSGGSPYVAEQYLPGGTVQLTLGPNGLLEVTPMYQVQIHVADGLGKAAARRYLDAILVLFTPRTAITVGTDVLRVRGDVGPFFSQLRPGLPGFAWAAITIPFRMQTANAI